ncbi:sperm acrosome-associated protein 9 [Myxocyprinus asiaticus]|uniref:sperm acrosome-associated protein 9 n=1 Tax=Myxocyprinus asiaticus TaxID=70543 RepID=UPI002223E684|nr:sperm acrosome-associated protein 9 [Myxocyprinus asiaticus]
MTDVKEQLHSTEEKYKRFKQQQFIFITALERSREHARDKTEPVSTVTQVQRYMNHHCSNATDRRIFSLFLEIISDLGVVLKLLQSSLSSQNNLCKTLETCKELLSPSNNINELRAHYPHSEINRLSCDEARNFYGGIVSVIPLALDLLTTYFKGGAQPVTPSVTETSPQQTEAKSIGMSADLDKATSNNSTSKKGTGGWHAGKPAWKPPGQTSH